MTLIFSILVGYYSRSGYDIDSVGRQGKNFAGKSGGGYCAQLLLKSATTGEREDPISDITGKVIRTLPELRAGLHRVDWNLSMDPPRVAQQGGRDPAVEVAAEVEEAAVAVVSAASRRTRPVLVKLSSIGKDFNTPKVEVLADTFFEKRIKTTDSQPAQRTEIKYSLTSASQYLCC